MKRPKHSSTIPEHFISKPPPATDPEKEQAASPLNWLEEHGDLLYKFACLRVNDPHVAEDLVQETLTKAFANFAKFRHEASVRTWLFQILRNETSQHYRKKKSSKLRGGSTSETIELDNLLCPQLTNQEFSTAIEREEFWSVIQSCYEKIPEHLLETFLHRLANPQEKVEDLCNQLDIKPSNFSVRLFRTRLMLRQCLEKSWLKE